MLADPLGTNALTRRIVGCAIQVHSAIGPGVYENVYYECMEYELRHHGIRTKRSAQFQSDIEMYS